nr:hypothetical protein CTI12_AA098400 [Tanacetum cinerariifolium]
MIDVSLGQCKRAKQRELYDQEALLHDDLALNDGTCITIMSDSHKGLLDAVSELLPQAEHRKCTRHIYANFKKKFICINPLHRHWFVFPSGFQELEVRNEDESYGVILQHKKKGHNKASCKNETRPKPGIKKPPSRKRQPVTGKTASRGGLGSKGGRKGGRGRGGGNSSRGIRNSSRECPSSGAGTIKLWHKQEEEYEARKYYLNEMHWMEEETHEAVIEESHQDVVKETHEAVDEGKVVDKGKAIIEVPHDTTEQAKVDKGKAVDDTTKQGKNGNKKRNRQKWQQQAYVDGVRIYVKNSGRSERIANQKHKFDPMGTGSTPEKALSVSLIMIRTTL